MSADDDYATKMNIDSASKILNPNDINLEECYEGLRSDAGDFISPFSNRLPEDTKIKD